MPNKAHGMRFHLRECTALLHRQLDQHPLMRVFLQDSFSDSDYAAVLQALYTPQQQLERAISEAPWRLLPEKPPPSLAKWIEQDLLQLGYKPLTQRVTLPSLSSCGAVIGCMYVLEGSRFGARVILSRLPERLPRAFYHEAALPSLYWPSLMDAMERLEGNAEDKAAAVEAASNAFQCFVDSADQLLAVRNGA